MRQAENAHPALEKVTAFLTRQVGSKRQLLLFRHPTAGIQLPAGTVEPDEPPEQAVIRELIEETGIGACRRVALLGTLVKDLAAPQRIVTSTEHPRGAPDAEPEVGVRSLRRGLPVLVREERPGWAQAFCQELDMSRSPPAILSEFGGWVPAASLGTRVVRYLWHLALLSDERDRWEHEADGHRFRPFWADLEPQPSLVAGQDEWLEAVYAPLLRSCADLYGD